MLSSVFEGVIPPPNKCASPATVTRTSRRNAFRCNFESCGQRFREEYQLWYPFRPPTLNQELDVGQRFR
jgi:hypothetical protein